MLTALDLRRPPNGVARSAEEAARVAEAIGFPTLVRPSYVLGGRAMEIVYAQEQILALTTTPGFHVTERKLRAFVCCERDSDRQREQFAKLLAGELELPPPNGGRAPARRRRVPTVMGS